MEGSVGKVLGVSSEVLIVDALAAGEGTRRSALDVIGAGPRTLAGIFEDKGISYRIARVEDVLRRMSRYSKHDVVIVSAMTMDLVAARKISRAFRSSFKVLGGPITCDPSVVADLGYDLGVFGEGEVAVDSLLDLGFEKVKLKVKEGAEELKDIPNLILVENGKALITRHELLKKEEFNKYRPSFLAIRHYTSIPHYKASRVYVEVVRGCSNFNRAMILADRQKCRVCGACFSTDLSSRLICPQKIPPGCGYCSIPAVYGYPKSRDLGLLIEEIKGLIRRRVKRIILSGADFLEYGREEVANPPTHPSEPKPNLEAIEMLLSSVTSIPEVRKGKVYIGVENAKASLLTEETLILLANYLPGAVIHVGIETGDDRHATLLGRPSLPSKDVKAIELAIKAGLRVYVYFIHGLPGQTIETARKTVSMIERLYLAGVEKVTVYRFKPLPCSAFERMPEGPPSSRDPASRMIERAARKFNLERKKELVGKVIEVVLAPGRRGRLRVAYPFKEGPTVIVKGVPKGLRVGDVFKSEIVSAESDRLVLGKFLAN
ncbi:MAG: hypothetical protein DRN90_05330 [Thermoproteota archaeon]|nr:MAG: hypothetical protein DRN90_05330 [Candidatus Korarchaeota archaeon]